MPSRPISLGILVVSLGLLSCSASAPQGVLLVVELEGPGNRPSEVLLTWLNEDEVLFSDRPVLQPSPRPKGGSSLGSVFIETAGPQRGRRAIARGLVGGEVAWEGAQRIEIGPGSRTVVTLLLRAQRLPDSDADGIPDEVDDCPAVGDPTGRCAVLPDAAADVDGSQPPGDAGSDLPDQDGGADALEVDGPDAGLDLPADVELDAVSADFPDRPDAPGSDLPNDAGARPDAPVIDSLSPG